MYILNIHIIHIIKNKKNSYTLKKNISNSKTSVLFQKFFYKSIIFNMKLYNT